MKYDELMDRITVTEDMRRRVLANVEGRLARPAARRRRILTRAAALAACLALVIAAVALPRVSTPVEHVPGIETVRDVSSLSEAVGYEVSEPSALPFEADAAVYTAYGDMAEIDYSGGGDRAVYRQSPGSADNSGDYNEYAAVTDVTACGVRVTLKGEAQDKYTLALWNRDGYSCSLSLSEPLSEASWLALMEANLQ